VISYYLHYDLFLEDLKQEVKILKDLLGHENVI